MQNLVLISLILFIAICCGGGSQVTESLATTSTNPNTSEVKNSNLFDRQAPEGIEFRQTQNVIIEEKDLPLHSFEKPFYLKVSMDPQGLNNIYLGKTHEQPMNFSLPKRLSVLYLEVYGNGSDPVKKTLQIP